MKHMTYRIAFWFLSSLIFLQTSTILQSAVPSEERAALIAIYKATNGDKWYYRSGWKDGTLETDGFGPYGSEGNWHGITVSTVNSQDHVTKLYLAMNNLKGDIPPELGNLKKLEYLYLYLSEITGIPQEIGNLTALIDFDIHMCELSSIPSTLGNLTKLTNLDLSGNKLSAIPPELGNLAQLTYLSIAYNKITSIPGELGKLSKLETLRMTENKITGIPGELGNLGNLAILIACTNRITSLPPELGNLGNLKEFWVQENLLTSIPPELGNLPNIKTLYLDHNALTDIPAQLGNLGKLETLEINGNQLTSIPPELGNLKNLKTLFLSGNKLTTIPAELGNLANLNVLVLTLNELTTLPPELGNLAKLTNLHVDGNLLSSIPRELGKLSSLAILQLDQNNLSSIPAELGNCTNLRELHLDDNLLNSFPECLGNLTNLRELYLQNNRMHGNIPENLGNLVNLEWMNLSANTLTGTIPTTLTNLTALEIQYGVSPLNINYNALHTADKDLWQFLDEKAEGWENTQTLAPTGVFAASETPSSIRVSWTPISYKNDSGSYIIYYNISPQGPWTEAGMTANKSASSFTVTGLNEESTYYFIVKTRTNPHVGNDNTVISEESERAVCKAGSIGPFGSFDSPSEGSTVSGSIAVTGWALDDVGIAGVKIYREGRKGEEPVFIGDALFVEGARPDIEQNFPGYPDNDKAGWGYMLLTYFLPDGGNGTFTLLATATDLEGNRVSLGTKTIHCDNAGAVKPFGAMDTPAMGGTVEPGLYRNQGWVLTPLPNMIALDGSTINVYVDGVFLGHPVYNIYREDIASLFPGYANSSGACGYFDLDLTGTADGVHTIYWTAEDEAGNADGIGSRYFTVQASQGPQGSVKSPAQSETRQNPAALRVDDAGFVTIKKGVSRNIDPETVYPDGSGTVRIEMKNSERLEVHLSNPDDLSIVYTGYSMVGGKLKGLPAGSTLDAKRGIFYWQPGPAFHGNYRFMFIKKLSFGDLSVKYINIKIE